MRRYGSIALVLVVLLSACSDGSEDRTQPEVASDPEPSGERSGAKATPKPKETKGKENRSSRKDDGADPVGETEGSEGGGEDVFNDGEGEDDNSSALHPAAGSYVYGQNGYERFCQATTCDQQALPGRQHVAVKVPQRGGGRAVVVSEIRASDNRLVRTTTTYSRKSALVTDVYLRFAYQGFTFENSYEPRPPVESLRFPLREGGSWSGTWEDSTSGDYSVDILGRETIEVGGAAITAYKLATVTNFRGDFEGSSKGIVWIDAATKMMVKTSGKIDVRNSYGRYISEFNNRLRSGPGYP